MTGAAAVAVHAPSLARRVGPTLEPPPNASETASRRRTTSPCWQEELTFEARGATTVKLLFYSRNTYMADSLLGGCVLDLGAPSENSGRAPRSTTQPPSSESAMYVLRE